jgi:hypothetical protein
MKSFRNLEAYLPGEGAGSDSYPLIYPRPVVDVFTPNQVLVSQAEGVNQAIVNYSQNVSFGIESSAVPVVEPVAETIVLETVAAPTVIYVDPAMTGNQEAAIVDMPDTSKVVAAGINDPRTVIYLMLAIAAAGLLTLIFKR